MGEAFLHGFLLSFGLILPIGVQNGFVITQGSIHRTFRGALPTIVTASICDTLLIAVSILGVTTIAWTSPWVRLAMGVIGCGFLLVMGWTIFRSAPTPSQTLQGDSENPWHLKRQVVTAASTSLLNPHAWMDTLAIIGGSAIVYPTWNLRLSFGIACVAVSFIWFFLLGFAGHVLGTRFLGGSARIWLNRGSGIMMWASAIYLAVVLLK